MRRFNDWLAARITNAVATATCIYLFAVIGGAGVYWSVTGNARMTLIVGSVSGFFLQLVLLPILAVGQRVQAERTDQLVAHQATTHRLLDRLHRHHGIPTDTETPQ